MKKFKILIDIFMLVILIFTYNIAISGILVHEILGILIWILFLIHLGLNYKWIRIITKKFNSGIKRKIKQIYIIDLLLFIDFIIITISGLGISQYLFTSLNVNDIFLFTTIHEFSAYSSVILIGIHMIMHFNFFNTLFNKIINDKNYSKIVTIIFIIISISIIAFSSISLKIKNLFFNKIDESKYVNEVSDESANFVENENTDSTNNAIVSDKNNDESTTIIKEKTDSPSLLEYLGSLVCTGCSKRCPLSHPRCGRGESRVKNATNDYNEIYN